MTVLWADTEPRPLLCNIVFKQHKGSRFKNLLRLSYTALEGEISGRLGKKVIGFCIARRWFPSLKAQRNLRLDHRRLEALMAQWRKNIPGISFFRANSVVHFLAQWKWMSYIGETLIKYSKQITNLSCLVSWIWVAQSKSIRNLLLRRVLIGYRCDEG